jgi:hypothetical protein
MSLARRGEELATVHFRLSVQLAEKQMATASDQVS